MRSHKKREWLRLYAELNGFPAPDTGHVTESEAKAVVMAAERVHRARPADLDELTRRLKGGSFVEVGDNGSFEAHLAAVEAAPRIERFVDAVQRGDVGLKEWTAD